MQARTAALAAALAAGCVVAMAAPSLLPRASPPGPFPEAIDLNRASARELDLLPSVGPRAAARIVEDRERNGPFRSAHDVRRVPGLPRRSVDRIGRLAVAR
jgi:competence protein ComEA